MKKIFVYAAAVCMLAMTACEKNESEVKTVTFENATLVAETGGIPYTYNNILWGKEQATDNGYGSMEYSGKLYNEAGANFCTFYSDYSGTYDSWGGWAIACSNDKETLDYSNQFSVYADAASKFAVGYYMNFGYPNDSPVITFDLGVNVKSLEIANSVICYNYCKGSSIDNFYYKIVITGYLDDNATNSLTVDLTECNNWRKVDLSSLGTVDKITFVPESNDVGQWGINVPVYFCIDNLKYSL